MLQISEIDAIRKLRKALLNVLDSAEKYNSSEDKTLKKDIEDAYDALLATAALDGPKKILSSADVSPQSECSPVQRPVAWRTYRSGRWCFAYDPARNFETRIAWEPLYPSAGNAFPGSMGVKNKLAEIINISKREGNSTITHQLESLAAALDDGTGCPDGIGRTSKTRAGRHQLKSGDIALAA